MKQRVFSLKKIFENKHAVLTALIVFFLVGFGCLMVYSASFYSAKIHYGNQFFFLFKHKSIDNLDSLLC